MVNILKPKIIKAPKFISSFFKKKSNTVSLKSSDFNFKRSVAVIAHRGFSGKAPENTMSSFIKAVESGADMIELDVTLSKDGEVVVIHDKTLNRTTNTKGKVLDFNLEELKKLDAGSWFSKDFKNEKIPTLEEVLNYTKDKILVNIEIKKYSVKRLKKYDGIEEKVVNLVKKYEMEDKVLISSFNKIALKRVNEFNPNIKTALLYRLRISNRIIKTGLKNSFYSFNQGKRLFTKKGFALASKNGFRVNIYTINSEKELKKFVDIGVNGIITNYPDRLIKILDSEK